MKKLYRSKTNRMVAGVFGGLEDYTGVDATLFRLGFVFVSIFTAGFPGLIFYIVAAVVIPENGENKGVQL